jgi:hypothetical protein
MNWFLENWVTLVSTLSIPIAWIFGGKQAKKVEIKKASADAVATMQGVYDEFLSHYKDRMAEVVAELTSVKTSNIDLQRQFNEIHLQLAKEVEASNYWKDKFNGLENKYKILEQDHETLKKQFENYKKSNK